MDYELLDSGQGRKLERFGGFVLDRPDPQAIWNKGLPASFWQKADAVFDTKWRKNREMPEKWQISIAGLIFEISLKNFKHTGVFPEQAENWRWLENQLKTKSSESNNQPKILNLFGYTGGATLAMAKAGAEVVHVDASKPAIGSARKNAELNSLAKAPIRWILEDAKKFVEREVGRGNKYDGVIMDPPSFGRGVKGEVWKIEDDLLPFLLSVKKLLQPEGFLLLNGYASGYTPLAYAELLASVFDIDLSKIEKGELLIKEQTSRAFSLPAGIFARFANFN